MNYGYFDDANKEYVITRPDTPTAWINYLGDPQFGGIITNNAGGYTFEKSAATGRLTRFRFNAIPMDQLGRLLYLRDRENGDYWSVSWQPVGKDLTTYKTSCRHGTGYTRIESNYDKIHSEVLFYIPLGQKHEVWHVKIRNDDTRSRKLSAFNYVEFTNDSNQAQDLVNLQYTQMISRTYYEDSIIVQSINELQSEVGAKASPSGSGSDVKAGSGIYRFMCMAGAAVQSYDGARESFIGPYRSYAAPLAVEQGHCENSLNYIRNSCAALHADIEIAPGEEKTLIYIVGLGDAAVAREIIARYGNLQQADTEWEALKSYWHFRLNKLSVDTPDENFNHMVNVWNAYQAFINFFWSRSAGLEYCGMRNGLGYRDTMNDITGIMHLDHETAGQRLRFMLSGQTTKGAGLPLVPFDHCAGGAFTPDDAEYGMETGYESYRCDDALWLFPAVRQYVRETGDLAFLDESVLYADKEEDTVYEHLRRALVFSLDRLGEHGLVLGLEADWNDTLRLEETGETLFASFQLYLALNIFKEFAERIERGEDADWAEKVRDTLLASIQKHAWEGDQFIRAIVGPGDIIGSKHNSEGSIFLNAQSWAVISGAATQEQGTVAMDKVYEKLSTDYGVMICHPAFRKYGLPVVRAILMLPGVKENAGIFSQPQGWVIAAETMLGNGNRAFEYYRNCCPATRNDTAELRQTEPYAHSQFTDGIESPFHGRSHVHWLTGTASTVMTASVESILGIKPDYDGLRIDPCVPSDWKTFTIRRVFRGKTFNIRINNPDGVQQGVQSIELNGELIPGNLIPLDKAMDDNAVTVTMGTQKSAGR